MRSETKGNIFYIFSGFLLLSACILARSTSGIQATPVSPPSATPLIETIIVSEPTVSPIVPAGSFADFYLFAKEIATALQDRKASFFAEHFASSIWNCLGDETQGVCKDAPLDTPLEGIPVTYDWATYELYSVENYKKRWQTTFADHSELRLAAVANQLGDNPLMPMAGQSFLAIIDVTDDGDLSGQEARVLFFEYYENSWHLAGELVTVEQIEAWLNGTCPTCYDVWTAWPQ